MVSLDLSILQVGWLEVSASGKTIKVQECRSEALNNPHDSSVRVVPTAGTVWGEDGVQTKRIRIAYRDGTPCQPSFFVASYASAYLWDGTPKHQTGVGWGH